MCFHRWSLLWLLIKYELVNAQLVVLNRCQRSESIIYPPAQRTQGQGVRLLLAILESFCPKQTRGGCLVFCPMRKIGIEQGCKLRWWNTMPTPKLLWGPAAWACIPSFLSIAVVQMPLGRKKSQSFDPLCAQNIYLFRGGTFVFLCFVLWWVVFGTSVLWASKRPSLCWWRSHPVLLLEKVTGAQNPSIQYQAQTKNLRNFHKYYCNQDGVDTLCALQVFPPFCANSSARRCWLMFWFGLACVDRSVPVCKQAHQIWTCRSLKDFLFAKFSLPFLFFSCLVKSWLASSSSILDSLEWEREFTFVSSEKAVMTRTATFLWVKNCKKRHLTSAKIQKFLVL